MTKIRPAIGSLIFLLVAPGLVAGVIPWLLTGWHLSHYLVLAQLAGAAIVVVGVAVLLASFARFVFEGRGTPAPAAPTERLVLGGFYRYVRNPMYLAVGATIIGQAIALGRPVLLAYFVMFAIAVTAFVYGYEEPTLRDRYGEQYDEYRRAVPGWLPRRTPWQPPQH